MASHKWLLIIICWCWLFHISRVQKLGLQNSLVRGFWRHKTTSVNYGTAHPPTSIEIQFQPIYRHQTTCQLFFIPIGRSLYSAATWNGTWEKSFNTPHHPSHQRSLFTMSPHIPILPQPQPTYRHKTVLRLSNTHIGRCRLSAASDIAAWAKS